MTVEPILMPILILLAAGVVCLFIPKRGAVVARIISVLAVGAAAVYGFWLWRQGGEFSWEWKEVAETWSGRSIFKVVPLSGMVVAAAAGLSFLMTVYAAFFGGERSPRLYYASWLWVLAGTYGAILASNLVVLAVFWGFMGIPFYVLMSLGKEGSDAASKKALIIMGGSDTLLVLGIAAVVVKTGGFAFPENLVISGGGMVVAYVCFVAAAFAKAGGMPLHSWVPDVAETGPTPAVAFLPASIDKLLGIYLLARVSVSMFRLVPGGVLATVVMSLGALTIVAAVMMALVQHDLKRLLGFHAVSQVGYMVLGIGTGTLVGVAGGVFHMLNHAIYKSCLFLTAGSAERKSETTELSRMGGLARVIPVTAICATIAAFSISGVPPFNGFVSKWMIYQGVIEAGTEAKGWLWIVFLAAAMVGSTLTLASFVKVLYSVYLGPPPEGQKNEGPSPNVGMGFSMVVLACACVVFGVAAGALPLRRFIYPALGLGELAMKGVWDAPAATVLIVVALAAGVLIYIIGAKTREDEGYIGGEEQTPDYRYAGTDYYETVTRLPYIRDLYDAAGRRWTDLYNIGKGVAGAAGDVGRACHSGLLLSYGAWFLAGVVVLLWVMLGRAS